MTEAFHNDSELIPLTDRRWRERWATELTRANQLETALRKAEADRADWERIALENGERAAKAEVDRAIIARDADARNRTIGDLQYDLREANRRIGEYAELLVEIHAVSRKYKATAKAIEDLIDAARTNSDIFESCSTCGGDGEERSSIGSHPTVDDCPDCNGFGSTFR